MKNNQRVTPSVKKAIIALSQYLTELNQDRVKYEEEYSFLEKSVDLIIKRNDKQKPLIDKMMQPIQLLQEKTDQNTTEISELQNQNEILQKQIEQLETILSTKMITCEQVESDIDFIESNLSDYRNILADLLKPCPLPYPYRIDSYINWAIANSNKIILDQRQHEACEKLHNCPSDFNSLSFSDKQYVLSLLKECQTLTEDLVKEIHKADLNLSQDPMKHDSVVRQYLRKYAVIVVSMQKIIF